MERVVTCKRREVVKIVIFMASLMFTFGSCTMIWTTIPYSSPTCKVVKWRIII